MSIGAATDPRLNFIGDSDAHIVRGLIAILFSLYSGKTADEIVDIDAGQKLGLLHLERASDAAAVERPHGHGQADQDATPRPLSASARCTSRHGITTPAQRRRLIATHRAWADSPRFPNGATPRRAGFCGSLPISP